VGSALSLLLNNEENDVYSTGRTVELSDDPTLEEVCEKLVIEGYMDPLWKKRKKHFALSTDEDDYTIYVYFKGQKRFKLEKMDDSYCPHCGELMDKGCHGNPRCDICDPPCPYH
jgi:hypothetical protein